MTSSSFFCWICSVPEQHALVITRFGKFKKLQFAGEGLTCYNCCFEQLARTVSLKLETLRINLNTKTQDHTFMNIAIDIQYRRLKTKDAVYLSVYKLDNPEEQMKAYVEDVVRSAVNKITLDQVYREKEAIASKVKERLSGLMDDFGYEIVATPITNVEPSNNNVLQAMNKVLELERRHVAQKEQNERLAMQIKMKAEAEKVGYVESGKGLARKRTAIVDGLRESVSSFAKGMDGITAKDVLELILVTQYFDMLKDIGRKGMTNTIFVKHGPGAISDIVQDVREGFKVANEKRE